VKKVLTQFLKGKLHELRKKLLEKLDLFEKFRCTSALGSIFDENNIT